MIVKCFFILQILLFPTIVLAGDQMMLQEVKNHKDFDVKVFANGNYSGKSVDLTIVSRINKEVEIKIPAGTIFYTQKEDQQQLILLEDHVVMLGKKSIQNSLLDAYCTEASDGVPEKGQTMDFMLTKRSQLQKMANYFNTNPVFDHQVMQEATWCVSDGESISNIYAPDNRKSKDLIHFVAKLTGQQPTWHSIQRQHTILNNHIVSHPVNLVGEIQFTTKETTTLKREIVREDGQVVFQHSGSKSFEAGKQVKLGFEIEVKGWHTGKYLVVYTDQKGQTLFKQEFKI